jgi:hypothetical protein
MIFNNSAYWRLLSTIFGLLMAILLSTVLIHGQNRVASTADHSASGTVSWNITDPKAPLLVAPELSHSSLDSRLAYPGRDFAFPLLQVLFYEAQCDCFALMVVLPQSTAPQMLHLRRVSSDNIYRSVNGPSVELENSDSIKVVTSANNTRFLFALVGDGEWRCVAIHDPFGNYLLIDYLPDGSIALLRDSFSRSVEFNYSERGISFTQTTKETEPVVSLEAK